MISSSGKTLFYPGGLTKAAHAGDKRRRDQADADKETYNEQKIARQRHYKKGNEWRSMPDGFDAFDALTMYPFGPMPA